MWNFAVESVVLLDEEALVTRWHWLDFTAA